MRESKLARREVRDEVELEEVLHLLDREFVNRLWWWVPAGVVDEAVDATKLLDCNVNQILDIRHL